MPLRVPLTADQISAAQQIRSKLPYWREADAALEKLADVMPGFGGEAVLVKVLAINALYGTNVYAFHRMAKHIGSILGGRRPGLSLDLVLRIADLPPIDGQRRRQHLSFASKFCHFFLDRDEFPIYDTWARQTLRRHLGQLVEDNQNPYLAFVDGLGRLRREARLVVDASALDSYLWIRGGYEAWLENPALNMNRELKAFFEANHKVRLLRRLRRQRV